MYMYLHVCIHTYVHTVHVSMLMIIKSHVLCCYSANTASVLIGGISDLIKSRSIASVIFFTLCIPSVRLQNIIFVVVVVFVYCFSAAVFIMRDYCTCTVLSSFCTVRLDMLG